MGSITKTLDWIGIKKCIEKWRIAKALKLYKKDIENAKKNERNNYSGCHRELGAQGEVILQSDLYFNQGIRNIIIDWKNRIDKQEEKNVDEWGKELDILSGIVENIIKGLRVWLDFILVAVNILTILLVVWILFWTGK